MGGFNALEYWLASFIPVIVIERIGRRRLMLFGATGQMCSMIVLAVTVRDGGRVAGYIGATCLFLFNTFFAIGWLAIPWCKSINALCILRELLVADLGYSVSGRNLDAENPLAWHSNCVGKQLDLQLRCKLNRRQPQWGSLSH